MPNENDPLTPEELEKLLHCLDVTCQNIHRLLNQGVVAESLDDERITAGRKKWTDTGIKSEKNRSE